MTKQSYSVFLSEEQIIYGILYNSEDCSGLPIDLSSQRLANSYSPEEELLFPLTSRGLGDLQLFENIEIFSANFTDPIKSCNFSVSDTDSAAVNYQTCEIEVCSGQTVTFDGCDCINDSVFRLYDNQTEVKIVDDNCGSCSLLQHSVISGPCRIFSLHMGCFDQSSCSGIVSVEIETMPSASPTISPAPTGLPTATPTAPTEIPTSLPTTPTGIPTGLPTTPTGLPTSVPTGIPTSLPTSITEFPTNSPSCPTQIPTSIPSGQPSRLTSNPTTLPTFIGTPTTIPSNIPSTIPSSLPTCPTSLPSSIPTDQPSGEPSTIPTGAPTTAPSGQPSVQPSARPTGQPSGEPTQIPTAPTPVPSMSPTHLPSTSPTRHPTFAPSKFPTRCPTLVPSKSPTFPPSFPPSRSPTFSPSRIPTRLPSVSPSQLPTFQPTAVPSSSPSYLPTFAPTYLNAVLTLTNTSDSLENPSACTYSLSSSGSDCTFRSAINFCLIHARSCEIHFPSDSTVTISHGEIEIHEQFGSIIIYGHGSTLLPSTPFRLFNFSGDVSSLRLYDLFIQKFGKSNLDGGVLRVNSVPLHLQNVHFLNNYGRDGGVIYSTSSSNVNISNCSFIGNNAARNGAVIYSETKNDHWSVILSRFESNSAVVNGGVIYAKEDNSNWIISSSQFRSNKASSFGGVLYVEHLNQYWKIDENCDFDSNSASSSGGVVYSDKQNSYWKISSSSFRKNSANSGGVLYVNEASSDWNVESSSFELNHALLNGGVFYLYQNNNAWTFSSLSFLSNFAGIEGGVLYVVRYHLNWIISDSVFSLNHAQSGGVFSVDTLNTHWNIISSNFTLNQALKIDPSRGLGAVFYVGRNNDLWTANYSLFSSNIAEGEGGAIYLTTQINSWSLLETTFCNNSAINGGAIYGGSSNYHWTIDSSLFISNEASESGGALYAYEDILDWNISNSRFVSNIAKDGGAISIFLNSRNWLLSANFFLNNIAERNGGGMYMGIGNEKIVFDKSEFVGNVGYDGGAVYIFSQNIGTIFREQKFIGNIALRNGGALLVNTENKPLAIVDSIFSSNSARNFGGGISILNYNSNITLSQVLMERNDAINGGGLFFGVGNTMIIFSNSSLLENRASSFSGGVSFSELNENILIEGIFAKGNQADGFGGGIGFLTRNINIKLNNCIFLGNVALLLGGGVFLETLNSETTFTNVSFNLNKASSGGGVSLLVSNTQTVFSLCTFLNNRGLENGGGVSVILANEDISFLQSTFLSNSASLLGGGLLISQSNQIINVLFTTFSNNSALSGGGIYMAESNSNFYTSQSVFSSNHAQSDGGAIYVSFSNNGVNFASSKFESNAVDLSSDSSGGAIFSLSSTNISNTSFQYHKAGIGGSVSLKDSSNHYLEAVTIKESYALSLGGGISLSSVRNVLIVRSLIHSSNANTQQGKGGALSMANSAKIQFFESIFFSNSAFSGGTLSFSKCSFITLESCLFESNYAKSTSSIGGAAVFDSCSNFYMAKVSMQNNSADFAGGALYFIDTDNGQISNSVFIDNEVSSGSGSTIWISKSPNISISSNIFKNNRALEGSGSVYWEYSSSQLEPLDLSSKNFFQNNSAMAITGNDYATSSVSLLLLDARGNTITQFLTNTSRQYLPSIGINVIDYYDQLSPEDDILITASTISSMNKCGDNEMLNGETKISTKDGMGWFHGLSAVCGPGGYMVIFFQAELSGQATSSFLNVSFTNCTSGDFLEGGKCVQCGPGTYSLSFDENKKCHEGCPTGATKCSGAVIELQLGWWRERNSTAVAFSCPYGPTACRGGEKAGDHSCAVGHRGPLCAVCSSGYYLQSVDNTCRECPESSLNAFAIVIILVLGLFLAATVFYWVAIRLDMIDIITDFSILACMTFVWRRFFGGEVQKETERFQTLIDRMSCKTKIYVTLFQILSSLPFVLHFTFPINYTKIMSLGSILNFNLLNDVALSCDFNYDFIDFLLMVTIVPAGFTVLLIMIYFLHYLFLQMSDQHQFELKYLYSNYLKLFLVTSFLALPGISIYIFRTFSCIDLDPDNPGGSYLQADYSIACESDRYQWGRSYAIGMVFVYPVGVTAYYFWLLFSHQTIIQNRDNENQTFTAEDLKSIEPLKFLFSAYEPRYWYWEVIETIRRVLLTGVLVMFNQGSGLQIVVAFVTSLLFIKLYGYFAPFEDDYIDVDGEYSQFQISAVFFIALLIKTETTYDVLLVIIVISIFLLSPMRYILEYHDEKLSYQKYLRGARGNSIVVHDAWTSEEGVNEKEIELRLQLEKIDPKKAPL